MQNQEEARYTEFQVLRDILTGADFQPKISRYTDTDFQPKTQVWSFEIYLLTIFSKIMFCSQRIYNGLRIKAQIQILHF